jgi:hypothetical protein
MVYKTLARVQYGEMSAMIEKFIVPNKETQKFLSETCRQCRNDDGNFDHDNCVDTVDDTSFPYEEELYRTSDDKTCWSKDTYDKWLKKKLTNPNTNAILRDTARLDDIDGLSEETGHQIFDYYVNALSTGTPMARHFLRELLLEKVDWFLPNRFLIWAQTDNNDFGRAEAILLFDATWDVQENAKGEYSEAILDALVNKLFWKKGAKKYIDHYRDSLTEEQKSSADEYMAFFD